MAAFGASVRSLVAIGLFVPLLADTVAHAQTPASAPATGTAAASPADAAARAAKLKREGDDLYDAKHYPEALAAYDQAYALAPNPVLLYNRGRALDRLGRNPEALDALQTFAREAPPALRAKVPGLDELIAQLQTRVSTLTVVCKVEGARVLLGGKQIGVCPFPAPLRVNAGAQSLEAFADGYHPSKREVTLTGGASATVDIVLVSRDSSGLLRVTSSVEGARVSVDGIARGLAPAEAAVGPGEHRVQVDREGFDSATTRVVVATGQRRELALDPVRRPGLLTRWWFWTGVAVVAAAATATVIAVSTEKSAPSGDFSPGQLKF